MRNFSEGSRYASIPTMFRPPSRIITQTKSVKIIKDRDEKPKGFGYIEFAELDGLKDALTKSGTVSLSAISSCMFNRPPNQSFAGRTIRVSVAEPRKSRHVYSVVMHLRISSQQKNEPGSGDLEGSMMRNLLVTGGAMGLYPIRLLREMLHADASMVLDQYGSLPLLRFPTTHPTGALLVLPRAAPSESDVGGPSFKRRSVNRENSSAGPADTEETWSIGGKFKPSAPPESPPTSGRFGRGRGDMGPPRDASSTLEESDWRRRPVSRDSASRKLTLSQNTVFRSYSGLTNRL